MNHIKKAACWPWWVWIGAVDLFFVVMTTASPYLPSSLYNGVLHHFDLAVEMNIAAWWSSINLLALSLLAYELYSNTDQTLSDPAWLILAIILALLSLDEIGSLHERLGDGGSSVLVLLPYVLIFVIFLAFALIRLYLKPETRVTAAWLGAGFLLMGSVILQEQIEHRISFPTWFEGLRAGIEEGSELSGMFLIFTGQVLKRQRKEHWPPWRDFLANPFWMRSLSRVLFAGLIVHILASLFIGHNYAPGNRGNPAVWYPAALFAILFAASAWQAHYGAKHKQAIHWLLAAYFLISSVSAVYLISPRDEVSRINTTGLLSNFYYLYGLQLGLLAVLYIFAFGLQARRGIPVFVLVAVLLAVGYFISGLTIQFVLAGIFVFLAEYLFLDQREFYEPVPV